MPEFLLKFKVPEELDRDWQVEKFKLQVWAMAAEIQTEVSKVFFGWEVVYEVREFGYSANQSDFSVTGWVTDNDDQLTDKAIEAQAKVLAILQKHAFSDQKVDCWWQRVKGKWGGARGLRSRA